MTILAQSTLPGHLTQMKVLSRLRKNHLILLTALGFVVTLALILIEMDRQYFQMEKKRYIIDNWKSLFPLDKSELMNLSRQIIEGKQQAEISEAKQSLQTKFAQIVAGPMSIYRIALMDKQRKELLAAQNEEKIAKFNQFNNSLLFRNFNYKGDLLIADPVSDQELGRLQVSYTTPLYDASIAKMAGDDLAEWTEETRIHYAAITKMATHYKIYALAIIVVLGLVYYYLLCSLILPVRKVVNYIDRATDAAPKVINYPSTILEKSYNQLARDALLTLLNQRIKDFAAAQIRPDPASVFAYLPGLLAETFNYYGIFVFEARRPEGSDQFEIANALSSNDRISEELAAALQKTLLDFINSDSYRPEDKGQLKYKLKLSFVNQQRCRWFVDVVFSSEDNDWKVFLSIVPYADLGRQLNDWDVETLEMVFAQIRTGLQALEFQRRTIFKVRSEANISLSRNLGHDLTNIIATSKLDLMAVRSFLNLPTDQALRLRDKQKVFREAVDGLLNNTRFLQEIVNIYRSFSYVKRPIYEEVKVEELLDEIEEIFRLTLSKSGVIRKEYSPDLPACILEKRLVKLALFNLLSNAMESIRNRVVEEKLPGEVIISADYNKGTDEIIISVKDNGTGIRTADGQLASATEVDRIFLLGYSTKDEAGSGLGLNWVWSIVRDFHNGKISARNRDEGGAEFTLTVPRQRPSAEKQAVGKGQQVS